MHGVLLRKHHNGVLLGCLEAQDSEKVLRNLHDGPVKGHFTGDTTMHKVMQAGFYWPTLFKYDHAYAHKCLVCQKSVGQGKKSVAPLQPIIVEEQFH